MMEHLDALSELSLASSLQVAVLAGVLLLLHPAPKLLPGWTFRLLAGAIVFSLVVLLTFRSFVSPTWQLLASVTAGVTWVVLSLVLAADTALRLWYRLRPLSW